MKRLLKVSSLIMVMVLMTMGLVGCKDDSAVETTESAEVEWPVNPNAVPIYAGYYADSHTLVFSSEEADVSDATENYGDISNMDIKYLNETTPWDAVSGDIMTVNVKTPIKPVSMAYWFDGFMGLESIENIENIDTSNVTSMVSLFGSCRYLESVDVSGFNTSNVTSMENMFWDCEALKSLDVSNFDTKNVTDFGGMFFCCFDLESLDLSNFNTSNAISMQNMFYGIGTTSLDVSNFDTSKVENMNSMFAHSLDLTTITYGDNFTNSALNDYEYMFEGSQANKPSWYTE